MDDLIEEWTGINDWNLSKLHSFLKGLQITLDHLEKEDGMGKPILKIKTISGLAKHGDGNVQNGSSPTASRDLGPPPILSGDFALHSAGPQEVAFFRKVTPKVSDKSSGGQVPKSKRLVKGTKGDTPNGGYISVFEYFEKVMYFAVFATVRV